MASPAHLDKQRITSLLPMHECISVMEQMFRSLAKGDCLQPLRSLMWLPDQSGLLGMMPGYASNAGASVLPGGPSNPAILGIKIITIFHANHSAGLPSHQGLVILFDATNGTPLALLDAAEITAIRTAAASAVATRLLSRPDAARLAILGTGEQAERHIESIALVRKLTDITVWGRNQPRAEDLVHRLQPHYDVKFTVADTVQQAVSNADIICTVTASRTPILQGAWLPAGAHINAVGSCTPSTRELDTAAVVRSRLFTDRYESLFREAGEFLIPKSEGLISDTDVQGEIGEVLMETRPGRYHPDEITLFKSLGIAAEDLFAARHVYDRCNAERTGTPK
jgi:ornithine cyclodeaminase